jgi:hypothetical protein
VASAVDRVEDLAHPAPAWALTRGRLLAAVVLITQANALAELIKASLAAQGFVGSAVEGFGVSWAVWLSLFLGVRLALKAPPEPARRIDWAVALAAVFIAAWPVTGLASAGATLAATWFIADSRSSPTLRGAALVLLALAINLMWSKFLLMVFARPIEGVDAFWVHLIRGVQVHGNVMDFVGGQDRVAILSGCTSVANASLALLLWLAITRTFRPQPLLSELWLAGGLFLTVVVINTARLCLVVESRAALAYWHGPVGDAIVTALITAAALAWAFVGVRREILAH